MINLQLIADSLATKKDNATTGPLLGHIWAGYEPKETIMQWTSPDNRIRIVCDDSSRYILNMPKQDVNLFIVDPPFNIGFKYNEYHDVRDDYLDWQLDLMMNIKRHLTPDSNIMWVHYPEKAAEMWVKMMKLYNPIEWITWTYHACTGGRRGNKTVYRLPLRKSSRAWIWFSLTDKPYIGVKALEGEYRPSSIKDKRCKTAGRKPTDYDWWLYEQVRGGGKEKTDHPCAMPRAMIERLVRAGCPEDGLVIDPYLGSGTTAEACFRSNRRCIGIESDPTYFDIAVERMKRLY